MRFPGHLVCTLPAPDAQRCHFAGASGWNGTPRSGDRLNLSGLPAAERAPTWSRLQAERPDQAALIASAEVKALREAFDADVLVEVFDD